MSNESIPARFGSGQSVIRVEDRKLLEGSGSFTDDFQPDGQATLAFVRAPHAHARLRAIDTRAALEMPGVVAVYTGADLQAAGVKPLPGVADGWKRADGSPANAPARHPLAVDKVYFSGQPVCAVVADTPAIAAAACEAVLIDYDTLQSIADPVSALAGNAVRIVDGSSDNLCAEMRHGDAAAADAAFSQAAHIARLQLVNQRLAPSALEPRSVLAWMEDDRLTIRLSSQMPTGVRNTLAEPVLGMDADKIRVVVGDVGGGFGMKTGLYPEDAVVAFAARDTGRAVKWIATRSEELLSAVHGRDIQGSAEFALDADGRVLAYRIKTDADVGALVNPTGVAIQLMIGPWVATSIYDIPVIDFHYRAVLTNKAATGAYRGAGRPEAIYLTERLMDEAARVTGIDPAEIRRRNMITASQMPYRNPMAQTYDSGDFASILDQTLALADWHGFEARRTRSAGQHKWRGRGMAAFLEWTGGMMFEERVTMEVQADGMVDVMTALMPMGQGIATCFAQVAIDVLGIPIENIRISHGDTDRANGFGSAGSRSIFTGGSAVKVAAVELIEKSRQLAADQLECATADVEYGDGQFRIAGTDRTMGLFELAAGQPDRRIDIDSTSSVDDSTWPNGCHICEVEIDPDTGAVQVVSYVNVNDVGHVVNPVIVVGQLEGGAVQGIGQALQEHVIYDEAGQLQTGSFMDYTMPRALEGCVYQTQLDQSIPCKNNPLGVKGVGELGTIGATPAVANAVIDALLRGGADAGRVAQLQIPFTADKVWQVLRG